MSDNLFRSPKLFFRYLNSKLLSSGAKAMTIDGRELSNESVIAEEMAKFFVSSYAPSKSTYNVYGLLSDPVTDIFSCFKFISISETEVLLAARQTKSSRSSGLDTVSAYLAKGCAEVLTKPLAFIFNLSLKEKIFPVK